MILLRDGHDEQAMAVFYEAARTAPEGWLALAMQLVKDGKHDLALDRLKEVLALSKVGPVRCAAINNIGAILAARGETQKAMDLFNTAIKENPDSPDSYCNIGLCLQWQKKYAEAGRWILRALEKEPWHEQAQFVQAMNHLLQGDYLTGFELYECRWRSKSNGLQKIAAPVPEWTGNNGRNVFIYGEQGHGDSLLMLRYARVIHNRGVRQTWVAQKGMADLLRTIPEIDEVVEVGDALPQFDCHIPAVSLPRLFKTTLETIPPSPYLSAPAPVDYGPGFHVGIAWRGSEVQGNNLIRSTSLEQWRSILSFPGATFHSLQVENGEEALVWPDVKTYPRPTGWLESANRFAGLDLVITVDTATMHLAGALGVPCWCMLHCRPYFVFPPKCGDSTPWYGSVKLYRQEKEFEWGAVIERIANDLRKVAP
jgi:hypothetical protein